MTAYVFFGLPSSENVKRLARPRWVVLLLRSGKMMLSWVVQSTKARAASGIHRPQAATALFFFRFKHQMFPIGFGVVRRNDELYRAAM